MKKIKIIGGVLITAICGVVIFSTLIMPKQYAQQQSKKHHLPNDKMMDRIMAEMRDKDKKNIKLSDEESKKQIQKLIESDGTLVSTLSKNEDGSWKMTFVQKSSNTPDSHEAQNFEFDEAAKNKILLEMNNNQEVSVTVAEQKAFNEWDKLFFHNDR